MSLWIVLPLRSNWKEILCHSLNMQLSASEDSVLPLETLKEELQQEITLLLEVDSLLVL
jgi:hypothetical protein